MAYGWLNCSLQGVAGEKTCPGPSRPWRSPPALKPRTCSFSGGKASAMAQCGKRVRLKLRHVTRGSRAGNRLAVTASVPRSRSLRSARLSRCPRRLERVGTMDVHEEQNRWNRVIMPRNSMGSCPCTERSCQDRARHKLLTTDPGTAAPGSDAARLGPRSEAPMVHLRVYVEAIAIGAIILISTAMALSQTM